MNIVLLKPEELCLPPGDERYEHITRILHMKEGDSFRAGIIGSDMGVATITRLSSEGMELSFRAERDGSALYPLTLICAQVRPICMRRILREAVSLGVERIVLPVSDLGEKSYLNASLYRDKEYEKIILDGAAQAGMTGVSCVTLCRSAEEAIKTVAADELVLLDNAIGAVPLSGMEMKGKSVAIAVGPERGWSARERVLFLDSGYKSALLGSRILRTETAAVAGVALSLSRMGYV